MKVSALGDSALLVDFADESAEPKVLLHRALNAAHALRHSELNELVEITSAYQSVALFYDPARCTSSFLEEEVVRVLAVSDRQRKSPSRVIEIPVCFDNDFALDSERISRQTNLPPDKLVEILCAAEFSVACIGFIPGFPYLSGLSTELAVPRLPHPRVKVPAGSVALANAQAGIYPFESPGGWNIIGRTPLRLFDPDQAAPTLLVAGDHVRLRKISRRDFETVMVNKT